ncbi:MAG TPA: glycosyltransferase family 4 protein [Gemmatimonadales bacterium]|jgi:phosphatidylinositol alpha-mannosyltransferase|nr:glycosyltransferase family 4 protein [Gemmatimonadales bacterium]
MRIALVTEFYYPHLGGVTEHVHNLALEFRRRGHHAIVITSNMDGQGTDPDWVRRVGTSRVVLSNGSYARVSTGWAITRKIADILSAERIEIVHSQDILAPMLGLKAASAGWLLGIPVVATSHTWFSSSALYRMFRWWLQPRLDRVAARIAVSDPVVHAMSMYFRADWEVIPNGVDVSYFHPNGRREREVATRGPRLLFLGRLDPRNGLDTLLEAMPMILERHPTAELIVVGDGPLRASYEARAAHLGKAVRFVGQVSDERPDYYGGADLYLCPTTKASFGITLLEAMACGTPLVVSDITGFRELIAGGAEAVLVPKDSPLAWARATNALIEDQPRRQAMGAAGLAKAAHFAWPRIAERVLEVYRRVKK